MINHQASLSEYATQDLLRLLAWVALGSFLGYLFNHTLSGAVIGLLWFGALNIRALYILYHWLRFEPNEAPPNLKGVWQAIVYNIYRSQTLEKKAQARLRSVINQTQQSMLSLEDAIVLIDDTHAIEWFNSAAERLLGLKPNDVGIKVRSLFRNPVFVDYYDQNNYSSAINMQSWVNPLHFLQIKITKFGNNNKLIFAHDNTQVHNLELIRKDFVANVSHELRTPLTVLSGYLENIEDLSTANSATFAPAKTALTHIRRQCTHMQNLIEDLLTLSYLESGKFKPLNKTIDVPDLINTVCQNTVNLLSDKHEVQINILSADLLKGSLNELKIVLNNLVVNAIKYAPNGGIITITWQTDAHGGYLSVQDNGIGIAPSHISRLTERFYRVDAARSKNTGGTGLGLSIVNHILIAHKARLNITSTEGEGSTFCCVFAKSQLEC